MGEAPGSSVRKVISPPGGPSDQSVPTSAKGPSDQSVPTSAQGPEDRLQRQSEVQPAGKIYTGTQMAPTRTARSATPPSIIDAGKIFTGLQLVIPLSILMFGFIYAFSKAVETYDLDTVKRPGFENAYYSSGFFAVASAISGGLIAGSCSVFAIEPINRFGRAVFPIFAPERGVATYKPPAYTNQEHDDPPPGGPSDQSVPTSAQGPEDKWQKKVEARKKQAEIIEASL